ncbi:hypothetical protein NLJ89_g4607 [Agrocybe chaxingu]|uniref:BTB domain-containing protein n=1 Tax=Agrocybe chaxingu TaxID=84603 RepID=A0A9W8MXK6_9AGAR|nr:hypothetical protein NLJ89_g4607 [Agrocybe chaxingu]
MNTSLAKSELNGASALAPNLFVETIKVRIEDRTYRVPAYHLLASPIIQDGLEKPLVVDTERSIDLTAYSSKEQFEGLIEVLHPSSITFDRSPRGKVWVSALLAATRLKMKAVRATSIQAILHGASGTMTPLEKLLTGHRSSVSSLFCQGCEELVNQPATLSISELKFLHWGGMGSRIMLLREERLQMELVRALAHGAGKDFDVAERVREMFAEELEKVREIEGKMSEQMNLEGLDTKSGLPSGKRGGGHGYPSPQGQDRTAGREAKRIRFS